MSVSQAWERIQQMVAGFVGMLPTIGVGLVVVAIFYWASRWVRAAVERLGARAGLSRSAIVVLRRFARWATMTFGMLLALTIVVPSFTAVELIQLLGISGVAIGFAFQNILQNFLAGILLLLNEPFTIGDQIEVSGFEGTVTEIQTRATTLRTYDGRAVVIPNAELFTGSVTVNTAYDTRRSEHIVGIGYGDDISQAMALILQAIRGVEGVCDEPAPDVLVHSLGDFSVNLQARWWTASRRGDVLGVRSQVIAAIKSKLLENGIDLPFPTQQVLFHDQTEETDGDRARQREGWPAGPGQAPRARSIAASLQQLLSSARQETT